MYDFSIDNKAFDTSNIIAIHRCYIYYIYYIQIRKNIIENNVWINKKMFIGLTNGLVNTSNDAKCISLTNQKCDIQPTLTNLHPNE